MQWLGVSAVIANALVHWVISPVQSTVFIKNNDIKLSTSVPMCCTEHCLEQGLSERGVQFGSGLAVPCPDNLSMATSGPWPLRLIKEPEETELIVQWDIQTVISSLATLTAPSPTPGLTTLRLSVMEKKPGLIPFLTCTFRYTVRK